ncbi:MAG: hypothetical protein NC083_08800 [Muribaculum sp.]|nr:hypothetical protein [Muribaculum sp.]MCM1577056.1 hypothetical protein [Bacteroides sp.]
MDLFQSKIYQEAARRVKFRMEEASKNDVEILGKTWYNKHFTVGAIPHMVSDFNTVLGKMYLEIAASTIDGKSAEPLRGQQGFTSVPQSMFTHAHAYRLEADEIREMMLMIKMAEGSAEQQTVKYITDKLFDITRQAVQGVRARLDLIILEALSNGGKFTFTKENDPQSPFIGKTINFGMPATNVGEVGNGNVWNDTNVDTIDPLKEIDDVKKLSRYGSFSTILTDQATLNYILRTKAMKGYVNSIITPNTPLSATQLNSWLSANGYPTFEVVNRDMLIQDGDAFKRYTPFKKGQLVFLPENHIGTIETRLSDAELGMRSEGVEYTKYGRIEVRKYTLGEKENSDYCEITKASLTAAPSMDTIDNIFVLDTTK